MADFDSERLISSVEERPYLWDACHKEYKDRDIRLKGWQEIAASIVPTYNDVQEAEKKKLVTAIQKRWKTARDAYAKSRNKLAKKKSGSGASKTVKYTYHDQLDFLDRVLKGPTDSNFDADVDVQDPAIQEDEEEDDSLASNILNEFSQQETDGSGKFKRKKRSKNSEFEESLIRLLKDAKDRDDDDDRAFLISLLPSIKSFNSDQKLMFRSQVLYLIMSIRENRAPAPAPLPTFPNAHSNYGSHYGPSTSTYIPPPPENVYPHQNHNPFPPYQQRDYSASTTSTPLISPAASTVSTSTWEIL